MISYWLNWTKYIARRKRRVTKIEARRRLDTVHTSSSPAEADCYLSSVRHVYSRAQAGNIAVTHAAIKVVDFQPITRWLQLNDSTAVRLGSLRSHWRNTSVPADKLAAVTMSYLFIYLFIYIGRSSCGRMGVARRSNRSQIVIVTTALAYYSFCSAVKTVIGELVNIVTYSLCIKEELA